MLSLRGFSLELTLSSDLSPISRSPLVSERDEIPPSIPVRPHSRHWRGVFPRWQASQGYVKISKDNRPLVILLVPPKPIHPSRAEPRA